tara:strand:- start:761 stop:1069 length:309 start_codon:yes stop_codon:yes gene_type:complete
MFKDKQSEVNEVSQLESSNPYVGILNSSLRDEFAEAKKNYKAAKLQASTQQERKMIMESYCDDVIDIAVEARMSQDYEFMRELNQLVDSLTRRTYTPRRSRY